MEGKRFAKIVKTMEVQENVRYAAFVSENLVKQVLALVPFYLSILSLLRTFVVNINMIKAKSKISFQYFAFAHVAFLY